MQQYRKLKPKWYINLKCFNQDLDLISLFNCLLKKRAETEQEVLMFESNSYHKE